MPFLDRDEFLNQTRIGIFTTTASDGRPVSVPVWYEWDGEHARIFSEGSSAKVRRLRLDARASLLVTNVLGEQEYWVAIDATVSIQLAGAVELAERLAGRYWDLSDPARAAAVQRWREYADALVLLTLTPTRIRAYGA